MTSFSPVAASLLIAVGVQLACQVYKCIFYSIRDRKLSLSYFLSTGGMPSSHSAFVTALTASVGLWGGFATETFAVSFVFSAIVIYDSYRLRGAVEKHAKVLKKMAERIPGVDASGVSEMVGHSPLEILVGIIVGGGAAVLFRLVLR